MLQSKVYSFSRYIYSRNFQFLPGIVLSQVIQSVGGKINQSMANAIPVFLMKDMRCLCQEMPRNIDASGEIIMQF